MNRQPLLTEVENSIVRCKKAIQKQNNTIIGVIAGAVLLLVVVFFMLQSRPANIGGPSLGVLPTTAQNNSLPQQSPSQVNTPAESKSAGVVNSKRDDPTPSPVVIVVTPTPTSTPDRPYGHQLIETHGSCVLRIDARYWSGNTSHVNAFKLLMDMSRLTPEEAEYYGLADVPESAYAITQEEALQLYKNSIAIDGRKPLPVFSNRDSGWWPHNYTIEVKNLSQLVCMKLGPLSFTPNQ